MWNRKRKPTLDRLDRLEKDVGITKSGQYESFELLFDTPERTPDGGPMFKSEFFTTEAKAVEILHALQSGNGEWRLERCVTSRVPVQ